MTVTFPRPASGTNRGIHGTGSTNHSGLLGNWNYWLNQLRAMRIGWFKVLDDGHGSSMELCSRLLAAGIIPVVRLYRPRPNPGKLDSTAYATVVRLVSIGVRYFEPNNEPNLKDECEPDWWLATPPSDRIRHIMVNWVADAQGIIDLGGLPGFPAVAQTGLNPDQKDAISSIKWYVESIKYLAENQSAASQFIFTHGGWIAVHAATLNHPFTYPSDPINQATHPGASVMDDDCCLRGLEIPERLIQETFGVLPPIIGTEGGVFVPNDGWQQWDTRYPALTYQSQANLTVQMYDWLHDWAPQVYGVCSWLLTNSRAGCSDPWEQGSWYHQSGDRPVVAAMKASVTQEVGMTIRNTAWQHLPHPIPYNPDAALPKEAGRLGLGVPVTEEFDEVINGATYRGQGFSGAILYCKVGDWGNILREEWGGSQSALSVLRARIRALLS